MILIYKWALVGGVFSAAALALIGAQFAARDQAVQTLVVSQAASLGVVAGMALIHFCCHDDDHDKTMVPTLIGFLFSGFLYFFCERVISQASVSKNTYFIGVFAVLLALTYALIALIPSLESHMAAAYFGDLTLASTLEATSVAVLGLVTLSFAIFRWRDLTSWSFDSMTFGSFVARSSESRSQKYFLFFSLLLIAGSVQILGLLFTLSALFLPAMVLTQFQHGYRGLPIKLVLSASLGVIGGFVVSLWHGTLPTVACIGLGLFCAPYFVGIVGRMATRFKPRTLDTAH